MLSRRAVLCCIVIGLISNGMATMVWPSILTPFALRLVRRTGWEELMGKNSCIVSSLFASVPHFPISDPGTKICQALELAYRNNINEISAVPKGDYSGFVRTDGPRGWRIELEGTGTRKNIQIHLGNRPKDTIGCILPGTGDSTDAQCLIAGSKQAMDQIRAAYGESNNRPVVLRIE